MTSWDTATERLLALATTDLDEGYPPRPMLAAHRGDDAIAVVGLRPFGPGELLAPLIELAVLLLPLGADRFALAVPGRAWSLDDPIPPVVDDLDLRRTVLTVLTVDGHARQDPAVDGTLYPYQRGSDGLARFDEPLPVGCPEGPSTDALRELIARRAQLATGGDPVPLLLQFARCLLRGHQVVLSPDVADHLEALTVTAGRGAPAEADG